MTISDCLRIQLAGLVAVYVIFAIVGSFISWDIHMVWVGNWDGLGRLLYAIVGLLWSFKVYEELFKED